ncbi:MAG: hypothetical protein A2035_00895 [Nitrospirae bacterium GWA2_42_11]|nr:MAG: hypothetical protein A2035_00895 [Nitrospirae bacterium GWA2_42_11]
MIKKIINKLPFNSIYSKLFLLFFIIGIVPLIAGSIYSYSNSRKALLDNAMKQQELEVTSAMRNIVILFMNSGLNLRLSAEKTSFADFSGNYGNKDRSYIDIGESLLGIIIALPGVIESAGLTDNNGNIISYMYSVGGVSIKGEDQDLSDKEFFRKTLLLKEGDIYYGTPEISLATQKWIIPGATPVFDRGGIFRGILYIQIYLDSIARVIGHIAHTEDIIFIIDKNGQMIAQLGGKPVEPLSLTILQDSHPSYNNAIKDMKAGDSGIMQIFFNNKPSWITYKNIPADVNNQNIWNIAVITSEEAIYAGVNARKYLVMVFLISSVLLVIAGLLGWRIARPIKELTSKSTAMSNGELASRVNIQRQDEIGQLAHAFNKMAASIQESHNELVRLSSVDGLTGLYNHREFQKRLEAEINRASRHGSTLSLLLIDIDYFKKVNDTYGHQSGDEVLHILGDFILKKIRISDFAARYGGEEFSIILPETTSSNAFIFSERLRKEINLLATTVLGKETINITVSIGIATFPEDSSKREWLIKAADQALYFAKQKGRNKSILYGETIKAVFEKKPYEVQALLEKAEDWIFKDIATSVEARLPYRRGHYEAVCKTVQQIAQEFHLSDNEKRTLRIAAMISDIGALHIPAETLLKPGPLNEEEWKVVKTHPELSVKLLSNVLNIQDVLPAIQFHHEHYDGSGYPSGLKGDEIPLLARILSIADAYHAMTSVSPYRRKLSREETINELRFDSGRKYDPRIVEVFIETLYSQEKELFDYPA